MKSKRLWLIVGGVILVLVCAGVVAVRVFASRQPANAALQTGEVTQITAMSSVESSGSVAALQSASLFWETTGAVAAVYVKVGDTVKKGDVLMTIDPVTAPQNVIQAHIGLVTAQDALNALLHPGALDIANAQKAVADAEQALEDAERDLKYVENPAGKILYDDLEDKKLALDTAQANAQLAHVSLAASAIKTAEDDMNLAYSRLQRAQTAMDDCIKISCGERVWREDELNTAQKEYQKAWDAFQTAKLQYEINVANQADDVTTAQEEYDRAVANLNAALAGPDTLKLQTAQATVAVAGADLADKQETLNELLNGADPQDIAAAQANVLSAQATIDSLTIKAPFDGEVLVVNYRPDDAVSQSLAAVMLANRSLLHVDVSVDETDVSEIQVGNPVTVTFDPLPDVELTGIVAQINPVGAAVQGLIKYTVRVDLAETNPQVLLGMTADVMIVTNEDEGALAVPLDAVQLDPQGEFVNRIKADNTLERVDIVSGAVQGDLVVVTGPLQPGDKVQVVEPQPTDNGSPFGPG